MSAHVWYRELRGNMELLSELRLASSDSEMTKGDRKSDEKRYSREITISLLFGSMQLAHLMTITDTRQTD